MIPPDRCPECEDAPPLQVIGSLIVCPDCSPRNPGDPLSRAHPSMRGRIRRAPKPKLPVPVEERIVARVRHAAAGYVDPGDPVGVALRALADALEREFVTDD